MFFTPGTAAGVNPQVDAIWATYERLGCTQWLKPKAVEDNQLRQVRELVRHCREHVPYYRDKLPKHVSSLADLRQAPLLTRELYQQNFKGLKATRLPAEVFTNGKPLRPSMLARQERGLAALAAWSRSRRSGRR